MKCRIYLFLSILVCGSTSLQLYSMNSFKLAWKWGLERLHLYSMDIFKAIEAGDVQQVRRLLDQSGGADKDKQDNLGRTPLHLAALCGHKEIVELLLLAGADKGKQDIGGSTPLHSASLWGHTEIVKILLQARADKDRQDKYGSTPLHAAARYGYKEIVEILLRAGADKDKHKGRYGDTPLHCAAENGHKEIVEIMLQAGVKIDVKDMWNQTAYDITAKYPKIQECIKEAAKRPCNAFVAGLHDRLGQNSPIQLLNGFGFITEFIVSKAVEGYRENQQEAQLL